MLRHANQFGDHYLHHFLYSINAVERYSIKKTSLHLHLDSGIILSSPVTVGTAGAQQPAPVCVVRWHSDSEGSCNWGDKERRAGEVLTIPRQQGSISRETKGTRWFIQQKEGEQRQRGIIRKGHPQFLSRNDLFPLCNKHLSDPFIGFIRSDSLVKPFPAAAAGCDS